MYLDHYHLKSKPFDLSPGPRFLWLGEKHKEALSTLIYGISEDLGFLLLTGDVGVGKTALIHRLISNLDSSTIVAHITDPGLGTIDFFKLLAVEFNIPTEFYSKAPFLIELEKFLYAAYSDHKKVLLIVDESQRLNNKLLDQIRVLSNIELSDRKLITIFFVGQPEFKNMLMTNSNRAIRQRIAINYHIHPLTESETGQYIEHRLKVAGATRKIFKSNAIREIFRFTGGFPRAINVICDHALLTGYASGLQSIDSDVIKECKQELNIRAGFDFSRPAIQTPTDTTRPETSQPPPRRSMSMGAPILIGLIVILGALVSYYLLWPAPRWTTTPDTQNKLADASTQQTGTVAEAPPRITEKSPKAPAQTLPKNEIARAQLEKQSGPRDNVAPDEALTVAKRQPPLLTTQVSPAPDPLPTISEVDSRVTEPAKAAPDPAKAAVLAAAEPEPKTDPATRKEAVVPDSPSAQEADANAVGQADVPAAETAPEPDPSTDMPAVDKPVTASGKAAAAVVAVLAADPGPKVDPAPWKETVVPDAPPAREVDAGADRQTAVPAAEAAPEPDTSTDTPAVDSSVTAANKAAAAAAVVAVPAAKPKPKVAPPPRKETVAQKATPAREVDAGADGQKAVNAATAAPEPDPSPEPSGVESDATTPGKTAAAVLAAKPATSASKPINTQGPRTAEAESPASVSRSTTTTEKTKPTEKAPSGNPPEATLSAKAETQLQSPAKTSGSTSTAAGELDVIGMENRLRSFLQTYCNTYAAKDLDAFTNLFIPDARENGTPFIRLLPKYKRNFEFIETIEYRIELQEFSYNENMGIVKVDGDFFLKWLPPDKKWRENAGKISMRLEEKGPSFLVRQLDYQGGSTKK